MIKLKFAESCEPKYMTKHSAACDLFAREACLIEPGMVGKVAVGVWIETVNWDQVPKDQVPELQIRARSGLAYKNSIMLANGVGTVDVDYPDEICVLLYNGGKSQFAVEVGMRIGQMALNTLFRFPQLELGGQRIGGFGSTNLSDH